MADLLDEPLTYELWVAQGLTLVAIAGDWYLAVFHRPPGSSDMAHLIWRMTAEAQRWTTLRRALQDTWPRDVVPDSTAGRHPNPLRGQLWADELTFLDDTGPVLPVGIHAGDLFSQWVHGHEARVLAAFDQFEKAGYHFFRTWITLNVANRPDSYWAGRSIGPEITQNYWAQLRQFVHAAAARDLVVHVANGDLAHYPDGREDTLMDGLASLVEDVGPNRFALIEGLNEARDTGDRDDAEPQEIERLVNRVRRRAPAVLYALSAYTGTEEVTDLARWTPEWQSFYLQHTGRGGHWTDKIRHLFSQAYDGAGASTGQPPHFYRLRRLGWNGEPFGPGASAQDNNHELDDEAMALAAAQSAAARQVWCLHSQTGVWADNPFDQIPGFWATPRMLRQLPRDLMRFQTLVHGGTRWRGRRVLAVSHDAMRCDHAIHDDGRFVCIIHQQPDSLGQPRDTYDPLVERLFEGDLIDPGTGNAQAVRLSPGQRLRFTARRGRVLVGRIG